MSEVRKPGGRSRGGREITESSITKWAEQAEAGYSVEATLRRRERDTTASPSNSGRISVSSSRRSRS